MPKKSHREHLLEQFPELQALLPYYDVGSGPVWCMSSLSDARKSPFKKLTANDERFALAA
jgi:hypothetical protein